MRACFACLLLCSLLACGRSIQPPPPDSRSSQPGPQAIPLPPETAAPAQDATLPLLEARCTGIWFGKPPLKEHSFDITLRNPTSDSRWFLLPATFPYAGDTKPAIADGGLAELQVFLLAEQPRIILAKGVGSNFWAIRLPGHGTVTFRGLRISSWWGTLPKETDLELIVASEILVQGQPLASCYPVDPSSASGADVRAPQGAGDDRSLKFWHPTDSSTSASVEVREPQRTQVRVSICGNPGR